MKSGKEANDIAAFKKDTQIRSRIATSCQKDCSVADYLFCMAMAYRAA